MNAASPLRLGPFQEWMQAVLVHPGGADAGLASEPARRLLDPGRVGEVVVGRGALDAAARLRIYASMYPLRTVEALRADYPALAGLLGERAFARLVRDYVAEHPSTSYTLARLGDALPAFVAGHGNRRGRRLRAGVARCERAASAVFDAPEEPRLAPEPFAEAAARAGADVRLVPASAFAILRVCPGAVSALDAALEGEPFPQAAGRGSVFVAWYRRDFAVLRRTLDPLPGRLLEALAAGTTLSEAVVLAARGGRRPAPETVGGWLAEWIGLGLFTRVERAL